MPSDNHETIFQQLLEINDRLKSALESEDLEVLEELSESHENVMKQLEAAGPCEDTGLMELLSRTRDQILDTCNEMEIRQNALAERLNSIKNKQKLFDAYKK